MKKGIHIILTLSIILCLIETSRAQQRPQYTQYMMNQFLLNPAIAGSLDHREVKIGGRLQWAGFKDAPQTYFATFHMPFKSVPFRPSIVTKGHHGAGVVLFRDITGPLSQTGLYWNYAYHHPLSNHMMASVGASIGVLQQNIDISQLRLKQQNDPFINSLILNRFVPDGSVGIWLHDDQFYVGFSITQVISNSKIFHAGDKSLEVVKLFPHYFLNAGYKIKLKPTTDWFLVPSIMLKMVKPAREHFDINLKAQKGERFWTGVSFREDDSFSLLVGGKISEEFPLSITYSFDYVISDIGPYTEGSHEITIGYRFKRRYKKVMCPDYFWD